jgi:hypothetical protein
LSFLDAYSGYHQIRLAIDDKEKIAFITPFGIYYYTKMVFGQKMELHIKRVCILFWSLKSDEMSKHILMLL